MQQGHAGGIGTTRAGQRGKARWNEQGSDPRHASGPAANPAAQKAEQMAATNGQRVSIGQAMWPAKRHVHGLRTAFFA
ncbi:MAG: hypothetical protein WCC90_03500, partial [Methylocella sp.]